MMTREELIRFGVSSGLSGLSGLSGMGTGPSFSPADIAGLELWLQADKGIFQDSAKTTPATSDGDVIGAWEDQSGNGNDALQGTTVNKPVLKLSIVNSRPVVRFDGANDDLLLSLLDAGSSFTSFFVIIPTATTPLASATWSITSSATAFTSTRSSPARARWTVRWARATATSWPRA